MSGRHGLAYAAALEWAFLSLVLGGSWTALASQGPPCDPALRRYATKDPYGYAPRGTRCEGIYVREIASAAIRLVSLTEAVADFDAAKVANLQIRWMPASATVTQLRAQSLRERLYYRMDAVAPSGARHYGWPTNILSALHLTKSEIGILAWNHHLVGKTSHDVYLPIRLFHQAMPLAAKDYALVVQADIELSELYLTLARVGPDGSLGPYLKDAQPITGYFPAEQGIHLAIPRPETAGIYHVEIGAVLKQGGTSTLEFFFFRPSEQ